MHAIFKSQGPTLHVDPAARLFCQRVWLLVAGQIEGWGAVQKVD